MRGQLAQIHGLVNENKNGNDDEIWEKNCKYTRKNGTNQQC